ncbi:hypothetical protein GOV08_05290 [Candidatus Woesearchaeota archaeon]|nr:hypothetical protein [Candidatus Woesearchaeota archaeon]
MAVLDKKGLYEDIEHFYELVEQGYSLGDELKIPENFGQYFKIYVCGVGSSISAGYLLKQYLTNFRVEVVEDYTLPNTADNKTLVFVLSFGEDYNEAVSMYRDAHKKRCGIITIDDGRKLKELCELNNTPCLQLQKVESHQLAYVQMFFAMLKTLEKLDMIEPQTEYVRRTLKILKHNNFQELTEEMSKKLINKMPLIYTSKRFEAVARKWKQNFNLRVKTPSFYNVFPSLSFHEITGFEKNTAEFYSLIIGSDDDDKNVKKIKSASKEVLRSKGVPVTEVAITGDSYLVKLFSAMLIGEWLSYNLAIKRDVDPSKDSAFEELKKRLKQ